MNFALKLILIIIGIFGLILGILSYNQNKHLQDGKKKSIIITAISILILLLGVFVRPNTGGKVENKVGIEKAKGYELTKDEELILRKKYKDLTVEEKKKFEQLEEKYDKMEDKDREDLKYGIERLRDERKEFD